MGNFLSTAHSAQKHNRQNFEHNKPGARAVPSLTYPDSLARAGPYRLQYKRPRWKGSGELTI